MHRKEKPSWIRVKAPIGDTVAKMRGEMSKRGLRTVCTASRCPNLPECWARGEATFMILGEMCTRNCKFCSIPSSRKGEPLDEDEPVRVARTVKDLGLNHVVITSVTRDDLPGFGVSQFEAVVNSIRELTPDVKIELLIPDFQADTRSLKRLAAVSPDIIGHNIETVERLQRKVRDGRASYQLSLEVLSKLNNCGVGILTKSSLMLGLGETEGEIINAMEDLRKAEVDFLTMGQYLRPRNSPLEVFRYLNPSEFERLREKALNMGFRGVLSGPLVRSSYRSSSLLQ